MSNEDLLGRLGGAWAPADLGHRIWRREHLHLGYPSLHAAPRDSLIPAYPEHQVSAQLPSWISQSKSLRRGLLANSRRDGVQQQDKDDLKGELL